MIDTNQIKRELAGKLKAAASEPPDDAESKAAGLISGPDLWAIAGSSIVDAIVQIVESFRPKAADDPGDDGGQS